MNFTQQESLPVIDLNLVDRLVLTGFMGSGKSTVGALLGERLGWEFFDLDLEVERREGLSVPRLFADKGEAEFRRMESLALVSLLEKRQVVIALGGGAPEVSANQRLLAETSRTGIVHLTAPFQTLVERCRVQEGATDRPVLADVEAAQRRFTLRYTIYEEIADVSLDTSSLTPDETVQLLVQRLGRLA